MISGSSLWHRHWLFKDALLFLLRGHPVLCFESPPAFAYCRYWLFKDLILFSLRWFIYSKQGMHYM